MGNEFKQIFEKVGEATETALVTLAEKINPYAVSKTGGRLEQAKVVKKDMDGKWKKDFTLEFSRDKKSMSSYCTPKKPTRIGNGPKMFVKGALGRENSRFSRFKWFINDVEIFDEDQNILELQKFTKSFDNSHIRCFTEDIIGQSNLVKEVKLVLKEKYNMDAFSNLIGHPSVSKRKTKGRKNKMKKRMMLLCDMEDDASEEPSHDFIPKLSSNMKSNELVIATDKKKKYKCKIVLQGLDIINKMSKDISSINNSMTQISKSLNEFNSNLIEEQDAFSH